MSTFDPFRDDDDQHTRVYPPPPPAADGASGATRTISPTEHARLMAGVRMPVRAPAATSPQPEPEPSTRPTRPPGPPPLPALRREGAPPSAAVPSPVGPASAAHGVHTARAGAALVDSLDALVAARGHLRHAGLENADLAVAEQLLLGVLEGAHVRGWNS